MVWDKKQHSLALSVRPTGRMSWKCVYSCCGRPRWYQIGDAKAIGVAAAREIARDGHCGYLVGGGNRPRSLLGNSCTRLGQGRLVSNHSHRTTSVEQGNAKRRRGDCCGCGSRRIPNEGHDRSAEEAAFQPRPRPHAVEPEALDLSRCIEPAVASRCSARCIGHLFFSRSR